MTGIFQTLHIFSLQHIAYLFRSRYENLWVGFKRIPPPEKPLGRAQTRGGDCLVCLPTILQHDVPEGWDGAATDGGARGAACAVAAARKGRAVMAQYVAAIHQTLSFFDGIVSGGYRSTALLGGVLDSGVSPAAAMPMVRLLQRSAVTFAAARVLLVVLPSTPEATRQAFFNAVVRLVTWARFKFYDAE